MCYNLIGENMGNVGAEIKNIYNEIAEKYDAALWYDMPYNKYMDLFVSYLCGKDVLDLGCAMGSFTRYIADKGYNVDGIDFSHTIFSCLTLWSITWREASSLCTSSTLIPASTISTITW